jgi:hypothetical protein
MGAQTKQTKPIRMTRNRALNIALEAVALQMQRYVLDANLYYSGQDSPGLERAAKKYALLAEAYKELTAMLAQKRMDI